MKQCNFDNTNLRGVSLFASYAEGSTFRNADLSFADLEQGESIPSPARALPPFHTHTRTIPATIAPTHALAFAPPDGI